MTVPENTTPAIPTQAIEQILNMQNRLKSMGAQLMASNQTVQELIKANMDLRAALHLTQDDKKELEALLKAKAEVTPDADPVSV